MSARDTTTSPLEPRRPVLLVVDHDPRWLDALLVRLCGRFGNDFRVHGAASPDAALVALAKLAAAGEPVALLLVEDAASDMLAAAHQLYPGAKRVLLVDRDYTTTSPAVQAMTLGRATSTSCGRGPMTSRCTTP